jgi:hypothetical protein
MASNAKSTDDLREQSKHLLYEIEMLYALLRYFETGEVDRAVAQLDREGLPVRNAVIESYQLHARQLIEFLIDSPTSKMPTAPRFTRRKWPPPPERRDLQALQDELSERVMHLGWKRSEFTDQEREVLTHRVEESIRPVLLRFLEQADPAKLCEGFIETARVAIAGDTYKPEDLNIQRLDEIETVMRVATTEAPATNNRGTATQGFPKPPKQPCQD